MSGAVKHARLWAVLGMGLMAAAVWAQPAGGPPGGAGGANGSKGGPAGGGDRPMGPPPEAIAACKGLAADAACSFTGRENQKLAGVCSGPPADRPRPAASQSGGTPPAARPPGESGNPPLACRPERRGPPPGDKEPPKR